MTQEQLARLAHVSVSTVSKAFAYSPDISEETREAVFRVAREYGCYDKYCKERYEKHVIGVICPEFHSRYYTEYLSILEKEINARGATMIVGTTEFNLEKEKELLTFYSTYAKVDGIIMLEIIHKNIGKYTLPIVAKGMVKSNHIMSIRVSYDQALNDVAKLFIRNGHRKIGFLGERLTVGKGERFLKALKAHGIVPKEEWVITSSKRFEEAGIDGMEQLLSLKERPTAILCAYDYIAIGAMHCLRQHGLTVPGDISLVGMDNIEDSSYLDSPLTSLLIHKQELCAEMVNVLFQQIEKPYEKPKVLNQISASLIERSSVGRVKDA